MQRDNDKLYEIQQEMAMFPVSQWDQALRFFMEWIAQAIDADNVIWIGAIRTLHGTRADMDPFLGWRLRGRCPLHPDPEPYRQQLAAYYNSEHYGKLTPTYHERSHDPKEEAHVGLTSRASMAGAGEFRVHRMRDGWIDFEEFRQSLHYRLYYRDAGIRDRIWVGFPVNSTRESFFLIDRIQKSKKRRALFTLRQAMLVGDAIRGMPLFHRDLFLGYGLLLQDKPLSPMEQAILRGLLTEKTEKQIAATTGQSPKTLHKYVTGIYKKFGANSRASLMALWLEGVGKTHSSSI